MKNCLSLGVVMAAATLVAHATPGGDASDRFYQAIRQNQMSVLHGLAAHHDVNQKDARGGSPLLYAAEVGTFEAMKLMVAKGADVNQANDFGATPLMLAVNDAEKAAWLVGHGADVHAKSKMGRTALLLASMSANGAATVKLLLEHGAEMDVRDGQGETPLLAAAYADELATMRLLLHHGAPVNDQDGNGFTPLMLAALNGNTAAVRLFIEKGADVNAVTKEQANGTVKNGPIALGYLTPLMLAAPYGGVAIVEPLLKAGARVEARDVRGMTPLMLTVATDRADPAVVRMLVEHGADANARDKAGLTAKDWAAKYNSASVLRELGMQGKPTKAEQQAAGEMEAGARDAAAKAVALLQRTSASFFREGGCVACHAQNLTGVAAGAAASHHVPVNAEGTMADVKAARAQLGAAEQPLLQRGDPPVPEVLSLALMQFAAADEEPGRGTDAMIYNLAAEQRPAGNWHMGISRPPMADGDFSRTATAIRALQLYGAPARAAEWEGRIQRAAAWLAAATPVTTEDLTMQLLGLKWAGADRDWNEGIRKLEAMQREDGGWGQTPSLASDAYATGEVLYTLHELGVTTGDPVYQRGMRYLVRTQQGDGSWHVVSRAVPLQPYFESEFHYGHDQWISSAGTAWAAAGLAYGAEPNDKSAAETERR